jgi:hypothetical protein
MCVGPWPFGITIMSPPAAGLTLVWVPCAPLKLRVHLTSSPVSLKLDAWVSCRSEAWGERSVGGGGVILFTEGSAVGPHEPAPREPH